MEKQLLDPNQIIFIQSRAEMNEAVVSDYCVLMAEGVQFEPAAGILDEAADQVYVWDGSHRGEAAKRLKLSLAVNLQSGTREEAEWLALTANQKHGLQRSRADRQQAIRQALRHPRGANLSDSEIARHCGVDHKTVGRVRAELETSGEIPRITARTVTRNGVTYQQDTARLNNFVVGPKLVEAVLAGASRQTGGALLTEIEFLAAIKSSRPQGQENLARLREELPTPHRQSDVLTAVADALSQLRQQCAGQSYEGQCPHCSSAVYYTPDLGYLFCETCEARWPNARALANENSLTNIDEIIRTTLETNDPKWGQARHNGLNDPQLRDLIAQRWGRGSGQITPAGVGYWVTGYPKPALWVGSGVLDENKRGEIPTLDGAELLSAARAALRLPHGPEETRSADKSKHPLSLLANGAPPAQHSYILEEDQPQPCPECGAKRVRGVNGSQRWCIGCGANWPTATAFLADVAAAAEPATTRRTELTRRFAELVSRLSPAQLSEVEAVIMRLETQSSQQQFVVSG